MRKIQTRLSADPKKHIHLSPPKRKAKATNRVVKPSNTTIPNLLNSHPKFASHSNPLFTSSSSSSSSQVHDNPQLASPTVQVPIFQIVEVPIFQMVAQRPPRNQPFVTFIGGSPLNLQIQKFTHFHWWRWYYINRPYKRCSFTLQGSSCYIGECGNKTSSSII